MKRNPQRKRLAQTDPRWTSGRLQGRVRCGMGEKDMKPDTKPYGLPLAGVAERAGFHVVVKGPTYLELADHGDIEALKATCGRIVRKSERDHVTLILRGENGERTLLDVGERGERTGRLPSVECRWVREPRSSIPRKEL